MARGEREEPRGGLGWGWGGQNGRRRGEQRPAVAVSGGSDRSAVVGDGERVGEYRWRARKLAAGSVGREEGRKRWLRGSLGYGGGHGGRRRPFPGKGAHGLGSRAQEGRRKG